MMGGGGYPRGLTSGRLNDQVVIVGGGGGCNCQGVFFQGVNALLPIITIILVGVISINFTTNILV